MKLIYKGSVKDLYQKENHIVFEYSNRYSIFDWGEMPDSIPYKGKALASMASSLFNFLQKQGISSHFLGTHGETGIEVQAVDVICPEWKEGRYDYSAYVQMPTNCLVPLEVIFRRHLGQGNSLEERLRKNPEYLKDLGMIEIPSSGTSFNPALIEFSTKLESSDRYLSSDELAEMKAFSLEEIESLRVATRQVVDQLEQLFASFGVKLWDGKLEYAFSDRTPSGRRSLLLVDSIGPDELRLTYEGLPLSKEFLRQLYGPSSWATAVKKAKTLAKERQEKDWKFICQNELGQSPQPLSERQIAVASLLYQALANEVAQATGQKRPFGPECTIKQWHEQAQEVLESK